MLHFLHFPTFIISLSIGLLAAYLFQPKKQVILVYPNPDNLNKVLYKDKAGTCYNFNSEMIKCPRNNKNIREYNIQ